LVSGALISQYRSVEKVKEKTLWTSLLAMQAGIALALQLANIGSGTIFFMSALPLTIVFVLNPFFSQDPKQISLVTYALGQFFPVLTASLLTIPTLEVFVPLVSRDLEPPSSSLVH
jgi:hypothetical protein